MTGVDILQVNEAAVTASRVKNVMGSHSIIFRRMHVYDPPAFRACTRRELGRANLRRNESLRRKLRASMQQSLCVLEVLTSAHCVHCHIQAECDLMKDSCAPERAERGKSASC